MSDTVPASRRFTQRHPCPVCGGGKDLPSGRGVRCYGFLSRDGRYAHCTREEYAPGLPQETGDTFAHRLDGPCDCGRTHADTANMTTSNGHAPGGYGAPLAAHERVTKPRRVVGETGYQIAGTDGRVAAIHGRIDYEDGSKRMWWERPGGAKGLGELAAADLPPYGAHPWQPDRPTIHVEGEKAREALAPLAAPLGYNVVGHVTGAPGAHSADALRPILSPRHFLWADSDEPGGTQMARTGDTLRGLLRDERGIPLTQSKDVVLRLTWPG